VRARLALPRQQACLELLQRVAATLHQVVHRAPLWLQAVMLWLLVTVLWVTVLLLVTVLVLVGLLVLVLRLPRDTAVEVQG